MRSRSRIGPDGAGVPPGGTSAPQPTASNGHALDEAIAGSEQVRMRGIQGTIDATGRPFQVAVPDDLTWQEACALAGMILQLPAQLAARRGPRLVIPRVGLVRQQ